MGMAEMKSVEQMSADMLERFVAARVRRMKDAAERMEAEAAYNLKAARDGRLAYATVAAEMTNSLTSLAMNMDLGGLVVTASDADKARAAGE